MNRTYSITDSLFGDGYTVHASTIHAGGPIVGVGKSNTIDTATAAANVALDLLIAEYEDV